MANVDVNVLRTLPLLGDADPDVLEGLAQAATERVFGPGEVILREGSTGRDVYLIIDGLVEVVKGERSISSAPGLVGKFNGLAKQLGRPALARATLAGGAGRASWRLCRRACGGRRSTGAPRGRGRGR